MTLKDNTKKVKFYDFGHKYFLNGKKELIGVTSLMKKHGLSANYADIPEEKLNHAAKMGSLAHKTIEDYCEGLPSVDCRLLKSFKALGLNIISTEYIVSDNKITASAIDLVHKETDNSVWLIDMKRTSTTHTYSLSWQLGIYKYLFELSNPKIKVNGCFCLLIKKGGKDSVENDECEPLITIEPQPSEKVKELLRCEQNGERYIDPDAPKSKAVELDLVIPQEDITALSASVARIKAYEQMLQSENEQIANMKDKIYSWMLEHDTTELVSGNMQIKLKKPYETTRVNSSKLKKDYPDIFELCSSKSEVKGNITINILNYGQ